MSEELYNQGLVTELTDDDRLSGGIPGQTGAQNIKWSAFKTFLTTLFLRLTGAQTIADVKTFTSSPIVPDPSTDLEAVNYRTLLTAVGSAGSKENISTSSEYGGELTVNADPTKFDIAAGKIQIVDSFTDPENPTFTTLEWTNQLGISVTDIGTQLITFVNVSDAGGGTPQFIQTATSQGTQESRSAVQLGVLVHENLTSITKTNSFPNWNRDTDLKILDLASALDRINIDNGNNYTANGANTQIDKSEGKMFAINANYGTDKADPNFIESAQETALTFLTVYGDSGTVVGSSNTIDTDNYNPLGEGGLVAIPSGLWTVHGILFSPDTGLTIMHYGQYLYDSAKNALDSWRKEMYNIVPELAGVPVRAVIAVQKGATDFTDSDQAKFVDPGALGILTNENIPTYSRYGEPVELLNGLSNFPIDITLIESGGTIYAEIEREGGGDVDFYFNQREYALNCTTGPGTGGKARIALSPGADVNTTKTNWVCAIRSGEDAILSVSETRPTGEFAHIYITEIPSVAGFTADGADLEQRYNDSKSFDGRSTVERTNEWIRIRPAEYENGMSQTVTIDTGPSPDSIDYEQTTGSAWQKHLQTSIPALQVSVDGIKIANHPTTPGLKVTDLNDSELLQDSSGNSLSGDAFNWVIWASVGYKGNTKLWINLPVEADDSNASAVSKQNNSDTTIPKKYKSVGILIASLPFKHSVAGGGTYTNLASTLLSKQVIDLRGQAAGSTTGGGATGIVNEFLDSLFRIISNVTTYTAAFVLDNFTTNRSYTMPDKSGTIALLDDLPTFGTDNQIPVINAGGTNFEYTANLQYNGKGLTVGDGNDNLLLNASVLPYTSLSGTRNVLLGNATGQLVTSANDCTFVGAQTGDGHTTGNNNVFMGSFAGDQNTTQADNTYIGFNAGRQIIGPSNTLIGCEAGRNNTTASQECVMAGFQAGYESQGSRNVFLGPYSGYYETGSDKLFIDNRTRTNEATARLESLMYAIFSGTVIDQELTINATTKTKRLSKAYQTLASSASIAMNLKSGQNASLTLDDTGATLTLSNLIDGDEGNIIITQGSTGGTITTISPTPKVINAGGGAITLTSGVGAVDILSYTYDGTNLFITKGANYT